jgi:hypothetical protein
VTVRLRTTEVENQQVYPVIIGRIGNVGKEEVTWVTFVIIRFRLG